MDWVCKHNAKNPLFEILQKLLCLVTENPPSYHHHEHSSSTYVYLGTYVVTYIVINVTYIVLYIVMFSPKLQIPCFFPSLLVLFNIILRTCVIYLLHNHHKDCFFSLQTSFTLHLDISILQQIAVMWKKVIAFMLPRLFGLMHHQLTLSGYLIIFKFICSQK